MASIRSAIVDAIYTAVNAASAVDLQTGAPYMKPTATVHRSKTAPFAKAELPAIVVYRVSEVAPRGDGTRGYKAKRDLTVRVECRAATAADGGPLEDALDPLTSWVVRAIGNVAAWPAGTHSVQEVGTTWAVADEDAVYGAAAVDFQITYITAAGNPDA